MMKVSPAEYLKANQDPVTNIEVNVGQPLTGPMDLIKFRSCFSKLT
jgi:hypothetical protein